MLTKPSRVLEIAELLFAALPRPFALLKAALRVIGGEQLEAVARSTRVTPNALADLVGGSEPLYACLKTDPSKLQDADRTRKLRANLGQLLLGSLAERAFEAIYRERMGTNELRLEDAREARSDTDYRVLNGAGRPVFRTNIKFHGALFRNARDLVGLEPEDCFPLATYKIYQAICKQEKEHLPYLFLVVGVPDLTGEQAADAIPDDLIDFTILVHASRVSGKREVEDRVVAHVLQQPGTPTQTALLTSFADRLRAAQWRVLSARRADALLRQKLFERVYAVRVRGFARNYRNAELDMHFSLNQDLTGIEEFLDVLKEHGVQGLASRLERGTI